MRVIGLGDDRPGVREVADVAAPCQRLVRDPQIAPRRALRELVELRRDARVVDGRAGRGIGTDEQHRRAERLHDVELPLRAVEIAAELRLRRRVEIAERLIEIDPQPAVIGEHAQFPRRATKVDEVVFEHFDGIEPRRGDRVELVRQRAADRNSGDAFAHASMPTSLRPASRDRRSRADSRRRRSPPSPPLRQATGTSDGETAPARAHSKYGARRPARWRP